MRVVEHDSRVSQAQIHTSVFWLPYDRYLTHQYHRLGTIAIQRLLRSPLQHVRIATMIIDQCRKIQTPLCIHRDLNLIGVRVFPDVRLRAKSGLNISSKYESHMRMFADVIKIVVG
jgi:hypothetical protein